MIVSISSATNSAGAHDNAPASPLLPVIGCLVTVAGKDEAGIVRECRATPQGNEVKVQWHRSRVEEWHELTKLRNGFRPGHVVQDVPKSQTRRPLGTGDVLTGRTNGQREQVLVQLHASGEIHWLPFERLRQIVDVEAQYLRGTLTNPDHTERFRLKALAYALESWNQVTGSLGRLDVDPLPHQIGLVHRIMTSDQSNWLIADDVGLGKTIEVGLLLAAMKRRRQNLRILVVCPAGVVRQWQDEMEDKFDESFNIYGLDFTIRQPSHWSGHDRVIVSIDRAKIDSHKLNFSDSGFWDLIVFDEAHHLTKLEHQATTLRFRLAETLRQLTDAFVFLTGTPHSGKTEQFVNMLSLLRPDLYERLNHVFTDSSVVGEIVLRNDKSKVTNANGDLIFRGQDTNMIDVPLSPSAQAFDAQLQEYLRDGYAMAESGGATGRAIGFVMTTYRKLASSSIAAIETSLKKRLERLEGKFGSRGLNGGALSDIEDALRDGTDGLDDLHDVVLTVAGIDDGVNPFFEGEQTRLKNLLVAARNVIADDRKLQSFLDEVVEPIVSGGNKLLVFTEYRATQSYLREKLEKRYPELGFAQINGDMNLDEKRRNIQSFNESSRFMVTTEAGGEGINLHHNCHILVNYDLPWNPGRLVQRAGRLYRYGQQQRVIVFNLLATDGFDNRALSMMLKRVSTIERDMATVGEEFRSGLATEIVGELLERVDIASILNENRSLDVKRTEAEIAEAIQSAKEAKNLQDDLFANVDGYDPSFAASVNAYDSDDAHTFMKGMLPYLNIRIRDYTHGGSVLRLELPEDIVGRYSEFGARRVVRVSVDRNLARKLSDVAPMDFKSAFFLWLIERAKSPEFGGAYAHVKGPESGVLSLYKLRWQNDQGQPTEEMVISVFWDAESGHAIENPSFLQDLLTNASGSDRVNEIRDRSGRREVLETLTQTADNVLASRCTVNRHPNDVILLVTADLA